MGTNISYDYGPGIHNVIITAYEAVPNTRGNIAYKPHSSSSSITINLPNIEVDKITKYSYDTLGRLINVDDGNNQSEYIYDKAGNRISKATTKN